MAFNGACFKCRVRYRVVWHHSRMLHRGACTPYGREKLSLLQRLDRNPGYANQDHSGEWGQKVKRTVTHREALTQSEEGRTRLLDLLSHGYIDTRRSRMLGKWTPRGVPSDWTRAAGVPFTLLRSAPAPPTSPATV